MVMIYDGNEFFFLYLDDYILMYVNDIFLFGW